MRRVNWDLAIGWAVCFAISTVAWVGAIRGAIWLAGKVRQALGGGILP